MSKVWCGKCSEVVDSIYQGHTDTRMCGICGSERIRAHPPQLCAEDTELDREQEKWEKKINDEYSKRARREKIATQVLAAIVSYCGYNIETISDTLRLTDKLMGRLDND